MFGPQAKPPFSFSTALRYLACTMYVRCPIWIGHGDRLIGYEAGASIDDENCKSAGVGEERAETVLA